MTSQLRYRTLVDNLARIYDATDETRTGRLQEGLTKVLETIDPKSADGWQHVKVDSMRLLRVWRAREDCQGDSTLADQILEALTDFATDDVPHLEITERPCAAAVTVTPPSETRTAVVVAVTADVPVVVEKPMTPAEIRAIEAALDAAEEEEDEAEAIEAALAGEEDAETEEEEEEEVEVDEEAVALPAPVPAAAVAEAEAEAETTEEEEVEVEEEETPEEIVEPEADSEAEADEEEEEEEGVEVEKRTIRGREYWLSSDGTLYAVADDDEIGEEVGRINKDGRPVFLAPK